MEHIPHFKKLLEAELKTLETELKTVGHVNPSNPADWEPSAGTFSADPADENEVASKIEEYEDNTALLKELEIRFNEVKAALARIADDTFGLCTVCNIPIEKERLEANAAATTCMVHMDSSA